MDFLLFLIEKKSMILNWTGEDVKKKIKANTIWNDFFNQTKIKNIRSYHEVIDNYHAFTNAQHKQTWK